MPQRRILIVVDSGIDIELLLLAFQGEKITYPVDAIRTAREAIFYLAKSECLPALVLLDLKLPDMPGLELLRLLRDDERLNGLPIVVLSATDQAAAMGGALQAGANSYAIKPVTFPGFRDLVVQLKTDWLSE